MTISLYSLILASLFASGIWLLLSRQWLRTIMGISLLGHAANLLILKSGSERDTLPQALILTAIVIGLAIQAVLLVFAYFTHRSLNVEDLDHLKERE